MRKHAISFKDHPSKARPSFADECDVNLIVDRYMRTGQIPLEHRAPPQYGDAPDITFYEAACIQAEIASKQAERPSEAESASTPDPTTGSEQKTAQNGSQAVSEPQEAPQDAAPDEQSGK